MALKGIFRYKADKSNIIRVYEDFWRRVRRDFSEGCRTTVIPSTEKNIRKDFLFAMPSEFLEGKE